MIIRGQPHCNHCQAPLEKLTEEECEDDLWAHGWSDWKTAEKHYCFDCADQLLQECNWPPCKECHKPTCERYDYCWAEGRFPLHLFPYETYYAARKIQWLEDAIQYDHQRTLDAWLIIKTRHGGEQEICG